MARKSYTRHWDCAYANGFNVLSEGLDVVMLGDCAVSGNISLGEGVGLGADISLCFSQILFLEISNL